MNWARKGISWALATRGAQVEFVNLPEDCGVNGIDDLLALWGPARVLELFEACASGARLSVVLPPQFQQGPDGMFRVTNKGERLCQTQLANYRASIITNVLLDDGVETRREFELEAEGMGRKFRFALSASEFASMDWPIERLGPAAITFPNQREYARTAIQSFSMAAEERCIYTHTGWREVDGRWLFLHAGGAISGTGASSNMNVRLSGAMSRYELRTPAGRETLVCAIKASLRLIELGPPSISFPLFAATCRAIFGDADFSVHLAGATGAFKSEVAALHQQHFGAGMDRLHLPGAWSSTGNALEVLAFHAKDSLLVIDDFAPQGSSGDVARYHAAAERVFRAAGNHAGRGRLDSAAALRESRPPRALILSTGEDIPRGQSIRARLLILELEKGNINPSDLAECQTDAQRGLYAEAMGGFVQYFASRYEEVRAVFDKNVSQYRAEALADAAHARTPEIVANLQAAFEMYLQFAEECGAVRSDERIALVGSCRNALTDAARAQSKHQAASEPTGHFLIYVRAALACGKAHLASRDNSVPESQREACGWRHTDVRTYLPQGDRIGWIDYDAIYLEPTASYRTAQLMAHDAGEGLSVTPHTLRKRLKEKGLLVSVDQQRETLTVRRSLGGSSKNVLHLARNTVLPEAGNDEVGDVG